MDQEVQVIHPSQLQEGVRSGGMGRQEAISSALAGSEGIFMGTSTVSAGLASSPHTHTNCESALFVLSGQGQFLAGRALDRSFAIASGDFIYVPPDAPHSVVNDGEDDLVFIVARNTQEEQVEEYKPDG